jgi:hypothetical protein
MRRFIKVTALAGTLGTSLGLSATLAAGPTGPGMALPPDPYHGQRVCVGENIDTGEIVNAVEIEVDSRICVPVIQTVLKAAAVRS